MLFDDHLLCPSLARVAAGFAGDDEVAAWVLPGWTPPRDTAKIAARWPSLAGQPAAPVVVMLTELPGERPATLIGSMEGRRILEVGHLSVAALGPRWWPSRRRSRAVFQAVERFAAWREAGLADAEQWVCTHPADTVLTLGRVPARSGDGDRLAPSRP